MFELFRVCEGYAATPPPERLDVYDLFCGAGGFTAGARIAGCNAAFACDSDARAIETHAYNNPGAVHLCASLPTDIPLPQDGRPFHLHASPPCQRFSKINQNGRGSGDCAEAAALVEWYIDFAMASSATSWSMEQVAQPRVVELVERKRRQHVGRFTYAVLNFQKLGVPQTRVRLIAGTPRLVAKLMRAAEATPKRRIRDVIPRPRGTHIRGTATGTKQRKKTHVRPGEAAYTYERMGWSDNCRSVNEAAPTVVGRHALTWVTGTGEGDNRSVLTPSELAALQTFPPDYKFPTTKALAYLQIGNAVPPLVATLMLRG